MDQQKIIDKLDKISSSLDSHNSDKNRINEIDNKLDDVQLTLKSLVTMVEYEALSSNQSKKEIEELKKIVDQNYNEIVERQHEQEKSNTEIRESLSYIKKIFFIITTAIISAAFSISVFLIKYIYFK